MEQVPSDITGAFTTESVVRSQPLMLHFLLRARGPNTEAEGYLV